MITIATSVVYTYKQPAGKRFFHKAMLSLPIFGPLFQKIAVARFTRTLGTLLSSGVPIMDALEVVAKTAGNVVVEEAIMYVRAKIAEGNDEPSQQTPEAGQILMDGARILRGSGGFTPPHPRGVLPPR